MRRALMLSLLVLGQASCTADVTCEKRSLPDGGLVVECPRLDPVTLSQTPEDPQAPCTRQGATIECGTDRYGLGGELLLEVTPEDPVSMGAPGAPSAPRAEGARRSVPCQIVGVRVLCDDGRMASLEEGAGEQTCTSEMLPGHGRYIVCTSQEDGDLALLAPPPGEPSCQRALDGSVLCEDGSSYEPRTGEETLEMCTSFRVKAAPASVVARCARGLSCPAQDATCLQGPASGLTRECEQALTPKLVCQMSSGDERTLSPETPCHMPAGGLRLSNQEAADALLAKDCPVIYGDVVLAADGGSAPDLRLLAGLERTHTLRGSLQVISATLPQDDESVDALFELMQDLGLKRVLGEVRFEGTEAPVLALPGLTVVTGDLVLADNTELAILGLLSSLRFVGGDINVSGHPKLELVTRDARPGEPRIEGAFVWVAQGRDTCELADLLDWALERAHTVLIAAIANDGAPLCPTL